MQNEVTTMDEYIREPADPDRYLGRRRFLALGKKPVIEGDLVMRSGAYRAVTKTGTYPAALVQS